MHASWVARLLVVLINFSVSPNLSYVEITELKGGSIIVFVLLAAGNGALVNYGVVQTPYFVSLPFLGMILAMAYELTRDVLRAGELSRALTADAG